jgi:hypothetical protein
MVERAKGTDLVGRCQLLALLRPTVMTCGGAARGGNPDIEQTSPKDRV